ncbi:MAG: translation initiation factor IF-2 [Peptostreptococcaceae bacterium]|nr:translation initiation factor IF-2 [Peptostreptococcaceae bacterium]
MSKIRVYQLAKELEIGNKELIEELHGLGIDATNHMSSLSSEEATMVVELLSSETASNTKKTVEIDNRDNIDMKKVKVGNTIIVSALSEILEEQPNNLIVNLMSKGIMASINQEVPFETAALIAKNDYGILLEKEDEEEEEEFFIDQGEDNPDDYEKRSPVVTVMGHVDHGKTSLLDAIRKTKVTDGEAGGITQHIGASEVYINNQKIVFLDTPGHEAFTSLRARGAKITDIAVLVVAADDGVMPQTMEAINHAKAADVPIIVAINKIDKDNANPDKVKKELADNNLLIEEWGGSTICVEVSAIKGTGIDELLEMIVLVADMQELKANPKRVASGVIIEARLDKGRGPVATVLIQNGTLKVSDALVAGACHGKIRAMVNDKGNRIKKAKPATAVEIIGLSDVPTAGEKFYVVEDDKKARNIADERRMVLREANLRSVQNVTLENLFEKIQEGNVKELNIIVKADAQGSVEAIRQSLGKIESDEVNVNMIHGAVGTINESDILLASASSAIIIGFNVRPAPSVAAIAKNEGIEIKTYRIIYEALEDIESAIKGMLDPIYKEEVIGNAEVRLTFKVPNIGFIAGSYVTNGRIARNAKARIVRDGIIIHEGEISSLRRFKDDAKEVQTGFECGIGIKNFNDIKVGDTIEAFQIVEVKRD